jgi:hypothetical protein
MILILKLIFRSVRLYGRKQGKPCWLLVDTIHCTHCKRQVAEEEAWDKVDDDDTVAATVAETIETDIDDANTAGTKLSTKATTTTTIDDSSSTTAPSTIKSWGSWVTPKAALVNCRSRSGRDWSARWHRLCRCNVLWLWYSGGHCGRFVGIGGSASFDWQCRGRQYVCHGAKFGRHGMVHDGSLCWCRHGGSGWRRGRDGSSHSPRQKRRGPGQGGSQEQVSQATGRHQAWRKSYTSDVQSLRKTLLDNDQSSKRYHHD